MSEFVGSQINLRFRVVSDASEQRDGFYVDDIRVHGYHTEFDTLTVVDDKATSLPNEYALYQNYPNPFNPGTRINFDLPKETIVGITLHNLLGQEIATLVNNTLAAGSHSVILDARQLGLPSWVYFYRMKAEGFTDVRRFLLIH